MHLLKKPMALSASILALIAISIAAVALATSHLPLGPDPDIPKTMVEIHDSGKVLVRGAKVVSVAASTINAQTSWGSAVISWVVETNGGTEFVGRFGGPGSLAAIESGHMVSFSGDLLTTASQLTVKARVVRDWSVRKTKANAFGVITGLDATAKSFVLATEERGNITVLTSGATEIMKGKATTTFASLKVGDRASVHGLWDRNANTLQAERIKVYVEDRRVFEGGRLKTLPGASAPTSMVVTFGRTDYTVNVATDTAVLNRQWGRASLTDFRVGHHIRVYGAADGTTIEASVVRNMDLR